MAAGFMITRILLVCLLGELNYYSAFPTASSAYPHAQKDGDEQEIHGYGTRRPLDYVRALRQHNRNPQLNNQAQTLRKPQGSLTDLSRTQIKGNVGPHQPQAMLPPPPKTNHSSVNPRAFQIYLDVPLLDLLAQNERSGTSTKGSGYGNYGPDSQSHGHSGIQIQSGSSSSVSNLANKYPTKYNYERENSHSVSKPGFQLDFSVPFPATSTKTSESLGHFLDFKPGSSFSQDRFIEPVKVQLASAQTESKWQPLSHTGTVHKQEPQQIGHFNPILSHPGSGYQTQHQPIYAKPTDDKLSVSSWYSSQHRNPQHLSQDETPPGQRWTFQTAGMDKLPSLPISKYPEHPVVYISHTSLPREDYGEDQGGHLDTTKFQSSWPQQQYGVPSRGSGMYSEGKNIAPPTSGPSRVHIQSGTLVPDSDLLSKGSTKNPNEGKSDQETSQQSIQLTLTLPVPAKSVGLVKNGSSHLVNIKPPGAGSVGSSVVSAKPQSSSQIGLKWPSNYQTGHEQTQWQTFEPFHAKPADGKLTLSSWHSSQPKTPSGSSWEFQKPGVTSFPSLPISKYPEHAGVYSAHTSLPRKDHKEPNFPSDPFQRVVTSHSAGSPFTLASESYDYQFKPSDRTQNVKTAYSRPLNHFDFPSSRYSNSEVASTGHDARKGQKLVSAHQYSHRMEPSHDLDAAYPLPSSLTLSSAYNSQKTFPTHVDRHKQEGEKFTGLLINLEGGGDGISGKTYFAAETPYKHEYPGKWIGKNTAGMASSNPPHVNLQAQVSVKKDSLKDLLESSFPNKLQSYSKLEQDNPRYHFPDRVGYSQVVQTNAGSVPKETQLYFSGGLRPVQDAFGFRQ